jgi:hypothetical protein
MSTIQNQTISGIEYINHRHVNTALQPFCPLENTEFQGHCQNEYHNIQLRDDSPCVHTAECQKLLLQQNP